MRLSAKGRYGLQLMVELALQHGRGPVMVATIAGRQELPPKFLHVLVGALKAADLVKVQRGPSGGCELVRPPARITVLEVFEALEGRLGVAEPGQETTHGARAVAEAWELSLAAVRAVLSGMTLADLAARQQVLEAGDQGYAI